MISKNQIKFVKSLQQKKNRITHESFVVESTKNVIEILNSNYEISQLFALKSWIENNKIDNSYSVNEVTEKELQRISSLKTASEVLVVVKIPQKNLEFDFSGVNIFLDQIKDPGNLGTIIRICDWFGVKNIYCSENAVDVYNPKVVQSTMGSISRVNLYYTNLFELIDKVPKAVSIYGAFMDGENLNDVKIIGDSIIVFGNESNGVSKDLESKLNNKITINKKGMAESLNVAVSAAIIINKFCN
ncbi:MAG: TrmH family RNA methyltransferase [Flavobacteriales bacterium]